MSVAPSTLTVMTTPTDALPSGLELAGLVGTIRPNHRPRV